MLHNTYLSSDPHPYHNYAIVNSGASDNYLTPTANMKSKTTLHQPIQGTIVMTGHKNKCNGLCYIPIHQPLQDTPFNIYNDTTTTDTHVNNSVYHTTTLAETIQCIHQCLFCQPSTRFVRHLTMTNSLGSHLLHQHRYANTYLNPPPPLKDTSDETRAAETQVLNHNFCPTIDATIDIELFVGSTIAEQNDGTLYTDQTGAFSITSYHSNKYQFVAYEYRSNAILVRALKDQSDKSLTAGFRGVYELTAAFRGVYEYLTDRDLKPKLNVMDNECSKAVEKYIRSTKAAIQLVNPDDHQVNAFE
eukprot:CCRYP_021034-RA/>CCRYP_021034-RA protein AED:0.44 eAED:0.46 QI:0/0/0/1/0/0/4/0/302